MKTLAEKLENQVKCGLITQEQADERLSRADREDKLAALNVEATRLFELEMDIQMAVLIDSRMKLRMLRVINDRSMAIDEEIAAIG